MNECWIIVADGARARFMALERRPDVPARAALRLTEGARLSNPAHRVAGRRAARKIKSGRDTGRGRIAPHGYTDRRELHESEVLRRFAVRIGRRAAELARSEDVPSIVVVADPRLLPLLRTALEPVARSGVRLRELARDYTWCSSAQLKRRLAEHGLLAERRA